MAKQGDRLEAARATALRVLATLPRAVDSLESNIGDIEAGGISARSVERLAEGFREAVESLEDGFMKKELACFVKTADSVVVAENVESAAASIQSFVASLEAAGADFLSEDMAFKLGQLSGAAEVIVDTMESGSPR